MAQWEREKCFISGIHLAVCVALYVDLSQGRVELSLDAAAVTVSDGRLARY